MHLFEGDTLSESWVVRYKSISKVGGIRWFTRYPSFWLLRAESRNFCQAEKESIELYNNRLHGLSPPGGLVSPSGGFASLLWDQGLHLHQ